MRTSVKQVFSKRNPVNGGKQKTSGGFPGQFIFQAYTRCYRGDEFPVCMVMVYKGSLEEVNKLASDVSSYKFDLVAREPTVYSIFKEPRESW